jgi:hypothetical protein
MPIFCHLTIALFRRSGVRAGDQQHSREWMEFERDVLQPFLARNPAVSAWLDPTFLLIVPAGQPLNPVAAAIGQLNVAAAGPGQIT